MTTTLILVIWFLAGIIGGFLYVIPYYDKLLRKYKIQYWIMNIIFGFYTLYEGVLSQIIEYRLKKLCKNSKL